MTTLTELKKLAEGVATPPPWELRKREKQTIVATVGAEWGWVMDNEPYYPTRPEVADMEFIAAANPSTLLKMIEVMEKLNNELQFYAGQMDSTDEALAAYKEFNK